MTGERPYFELSIASSREKPRLRAHHVAVNEPFATLARYRKVGVFATLQEVPSVAEEAMEIRLVWRLLIHCFTG